MLQRLYNCETPSATSPCSVVLLHEQSGASRAVLCSGQMGPQQA